MRVVVPDPDDDALGMPQAEQPDGVAERRLVGGVPRAHVLHRKAVCADEPGQVRVRVRASPARMAGSRSMKVSSVTFR